MKNTSFQEDQYLRSAMGWQYKPKRVDGKLGGEVVAYLEQRNRTFEQNAAIVDAWENIVPEELKPFCGLEGRTGNVLVVKAMPGAYMHQLKVLGGELLERIRRAAPRCGISKIQVVAMKADRENSKS